MYQIATTTSPVPSSEQAFFCKQKSALEESRDSNSTVDSARLTSSPHLSSSDEFSSSSSTDPACTVYDTEILAHYLSQQSKTDVANCLKNHSISSDLRARMVDWMTEVTFKSDCSPNTLFYAVRLMDRFLKASSTSFKSGDMHLIGVTAMVLASKMDDVAVMDPLFMHEHVTHGKVPLESILRCERTFLQTLGFSLNTPGECEFLSAIIVSLEASGFAKDYSTEAFYAVLRKRANLVAMANLFNYKLCEVEPAVIAASTIYNVMKGILAKPESCLPELERLSKASADKIKEVEKMVEDHVNNFAKYHSNAKKVYDYNELLIHQGHGQQLP